MPDVKLQAILTLKDAMTGNLKGAKKSLESFSKVALAAGAAFVAAIGVKSVKAAADFEQAMSDVSTLMSGQGKDATIELERGIKDMLRRVPKSADELGASAYAIFSAGITETSKALVVLEESARLATAGLGTTEEATNIMTSAINTFAEQGLDAKQISDVLFKTVKNGKTTISELTQSFGASAPVIASAGITLQDFSAATAALTTTGLPASQAQMGLRQAIVSLQKPTSEMQKLFQRIGVKDGVELINTSENMQDVFQKLKKATGGNNEEWAKAVGSVEALNAVTGLLDTTSEAYSGTLDDMLNGTNSVDEAFNKQNETAKAQYELLKNNLNVALIELGNAILPMLVQIMPHVIKFVDDLIGGFRELADIVRSVSQTVSNFRSNVSGGFAEVRSLVETGRFRASGGDVQAGQAYVVGERGAELFVPRHGGTIVPNSQMGSQITVNFNNPTVRSQADLDTIVNVVRQTLNRDLTLEQIGV